MILKVTLRRLLYKNGCLIHFFCLILFKNNVCCVSFRWMDIVKLFIMLDTIFYSVYYNTLTYWKYKDNLQLTGNESCNCNRIIPCGSWFHCRNSWLRMLPICIESVKLNRLSFNYLWYSISLLDDITWNTVKENLNKDKLYSH